jgi:hypothetical protein
MNPDVQPSSSNVAKVGRLHDAAPSDHVSDGGLGEMKISVMTASVK